MNQLLIAAGCTTPTRTGGTPEVLFLNRVDFLGESC